MLEARQNEAKPILNEIKTVLNEYKDQMLPSNWKPPLKKAEIAEEDIAA